MATRTGLHGSVLWSGGLWLLSFPLAMFFLAVIGMVGQWMGVEFGSPEDAGTELVLNLVFMGLVLAVLGSAAFIGFRGWRRHGERLALVAAVLSLLTIALFVLLPALA